MRNLIHKLTAIAAVVTPLSLVVFALWPTTETVLVFVVIGSIDLVLGLIWVVFAPYVMEGEG